MKRFYLLPALLLSVSVAACSGGWFGEEEAPPLKGQRIDALSFEKTLRPDEGSERLGAFEAPDAWQNDSWPQNGGYPSHNLQNLALTGTQPKEIWSSDAGEGSRKKLPLTAQPVVIGQSIFTLDTDSQLSSFSTADGKRRWRVDVRDPEEEDPVISGGIAADQGMVFVTAGYDELVAVDAAKGEIKWRAKLPSPSRAAPTILDGRVYVTTLLNSILALDIHDGHVLWEYAGLSQNTGLVGAASPAATPELIVPAFSSGEIYALRAINGSVAWSDSLASSLRLGGLSGLSDIRGLPVIADNMVYAISFGGKMAAFDLISGARLWEKDISGSKTPWVAGNRVFVITTNNEIVSLDAKTGAIMWVSGLAKYKDKEKREGPIFWAGPIMAGGRLLAFSTEGRVAEIDPEKGSLIREWDHGDPIRLPPVVVNGVLYILSEDGDLTAYK